MEKRNDVQHNGNYTQVSLLCKASKSLKRFVFNTMYSLLIANNLLVSHNYGFPAGDCNLSQAVCITLLIQVNVI